MYGQSDPDQMNSNTTNSIDMQNIPLKKVHVGDIDVAYKMFGRGDPIILQNGAHDGMDWWIPALGGQFEGRRVWPADCATDRSWRRRARDRRGRGRTPCHGS